jgi:hypothetical protein
LQIWDFRHEKVCERIETVRHLTPLSQLTVEVFTIYKNLIGALNRIWAGIILQTLLTKICNFGKELKSGSLSNLLFKESLLIHQVCQLLISDKNDHISRVQLTSLS